MLKANSYETSFIVGSRKAREWLSIGSILFSKNGLPYGLIGTTSDDNWLYIAATAKEPDYPFTTSMLKHIIKLSRQHNICLITDHPNSRLRMQKVLQKYGGFTFEHRDDALYSYRKKG